MLTIARMNAHSVAYYQSTVEENQGPDSYYSTVKRFMIGSITPLLRVGQSSVGHQEQMVFLVSI